MTELEQVITCPGCEGDGWIENDKRIVFECPMCEQRGLLVIDEKKTLKNPVKPKPSTAYGERASEIARSMARYRP